MKHRLLRLPLLLLLAASACGPGGNSTGAAVATPAYDTTLPRGAVVDSVAGRGAGQPYALYLPSYYTPARKFPCIYFFDAHARGALPIYLYKDLAEKYGFIIVGSDVSKNGTPWQETEEIVRQCMSDTRARLNIDSARIYTGGLSGGSRVASTVAMHNPGIAGVIGCAAGLPEADQPIQHKFDYVGLAGDADFNYNEMTHLSTYLVQNGFQAELITFSGIHGWPPAADMRMAMLWLQAAAMKEHRQPAADTLITELKTEYDTRIAAARNGNDVITLYRLLGGKIRILDGLADVQADKKQFADVAASEQYKVELSVEAELQQEEAAQQQELVKQFTQANPAGRAALIALLKNKTASDDLLHAAKYKRLLSTLGLICYMSVSHALGSGDQQLAAQYLDAFSLADPQNPDHSYLSALLYMQKNDPTQALASLNQAADLGYSEMATILTEPTLATLRGNPEFQKVLERIKENNKGPR